MDAAAVKAVLPFYIDVLTRLGEAFGFADLEVERVDFEGT